MTMIRMAQYGTKHGHAAGKLVAMLKHPAVEVAGVYEPDSARRRALETSDGPFRTVYWFADEAELLADSSIVAVASEGRNDESLLQTEALVQAGKHVWYDKPAGDDWAHWQRVYELIKTQGQVFQMGYMFRYHAGFQQIADWVKSGLLGDIFSVRAHMSTSISQTQRETINRHQGGIFFDLAGHMLDQVVWLLGRPDKITPFLRHDDTIVPGFVDNALVVLEYERAIACIDIAAMEIPPTARRFEVYGSRGSAIMEPLEPATELRLCLAEAQAGYQAGVQVVSLETQSRQALYELELAAFLATIQGRQPPDRSLAHEDLVQETLLRCCDLVVL